VLFKTVLSPSSCNTLIDRLFSMTQVMTAIAANPCPPLVLDCRMDISISIQHTIFWFFNYDFVFILFQKSYLGTLVDVPHRTQCTYVHIRVCEERKVSRAPACSQGKYYSFSNKPHNINKLCTYVQITLTRLIQLKSDFTSVPAAMKWRGESENPF